MLFFFFLCYCNRYIEPLVVHGHTVNTLQKRHNFILSLTINNRVAFDDR